LRKRISPMKKCGRLHTRISRKRFFLFTRAALSPIVP